MKIAVIISGMFRELEHCFSTWTFLNHLDADYYFSVWDTTTETNEKLGINTSVKVTYESISQQVQPFSYTIDPSAHADPSPLKNMVIRWSHGINLVIGSKIKYDAILIIRPDVFVDAVDSNFLKTLVDMQPGVFYCPGGAMEHVNGARGSDVVGVNDFMIVGLPETMEKLLTIGDDARNTENLVDIHEWLFDWLSAHGRVEDLFGLERYCLFRSISRHRINRDWDLINSDASLWWETKHGVRY